MPSRRSTSPSRQGLVSPTKEEHSNPFLTFVEEFPPAALHTVILIPPEVRTGERCGNGEGERTDSRGEGQYWRIVCDGKLLHHHVGRRYDRDDLTYLLQHLFSESVDGWLHVYVEIQPGRLEQSLRLNQRELRVQEYERKEFQRLSSQPISPPLSPSRASPASATGSPTTTAVGKCVLCGGFNLALNKEQGCMHPPSYCEPCLQRWINDKLLQTLQANVLSVYCPDPGCGVSLSVTRTIRKYATEDDFVALCDRINRQREKESCINETSDLSPCCSNSGCGSPLSPGTQQQDGQFLTCSACKMITCASCGGAFHPGVPCQPKRQVTPEKKAPLGNEGRRLQPCRLELQAEEDDDSEPKRVQGTDRTAASVGNDAERQLGDTEVTTSPSASPTKRAVCHHHFLLGDPLSVEAICQTCKAVTCRRCRAPFHGDSDCAKLSKLREVELYRQIGKWAIETKKAVLIGRSLIGIQNSDFDELFSTACAEPQGEGTEDLSSVLEAKQREDARHLLRARIEAAKPRYEFAARRLRSIEEAREGRPASDPALVREEDKTLSPSTDALNDGDLEEEVDIGDLNAVLDELSTLQDQFPSRYNRFKDENLEKRIEECRRNLIELVKAVDECVRSDLKKIHDFERTHC